MTATMVRPTVVVGILLAAAGYAATKEWQWQVELPLMSMVQVERVDTPLAQTAEWQSEAVTVQPEQIFQD